MHRQIATLQFTCMNSDGGYAAAPNVQSKTNAGGSREGSKNCTAGDNVVSSSDGTWGGCRGTKAVTHSGKWYYEASVARSGEGVCVCGLALPPRPLVSQTFVRAQKSGISLSIRNEGANMEDFQGSVLVLPHLCPLSVSEVGYAEYIRKALEEGFSEMYGLGPGRSLTGGGKNVFCYTVFPKKACGHTMYWRWAAGGWRLATGGWWRLVVVGGGWRRLVVGDW